MKALNLTLRFILELAALATFGYLGYTVFSSPINYALMLVIPLVAASIWGIFATKNDPSRSGKTVVPTPGYLRLILEFIFFASAVFVLYKLGHPLLSLLFAFLVGIHYVFSGERLRFMLGKEQGEVGNE